MATVFVGLSGGVDSAVAAALLKEQNHDVIGCFIKIWQPEFVECSWQEDRLDAMRVAAALGIPFREVDFSDAYKHEVIEDMIDGYTRGVTPNPDVLCNRTIKFGHFLRWARENGAEGIATGHHARVRRNTCGFQLLRGKDRAKDQSYFLWQLGQRELSLTLFPIGNLTKQDVRKLAKKFNLPNAGKPDSQGLCFVGDVSMEDFLAHFITLTPGPVDNINGERIGEHRGAALYTIGQRHGFTFKQGSGSSPRYVVAVDAKRNAVTVSENSLDAARNEVFIEDMHWILDTPPQSCAASIQARYRETPVPAVVNKEKGRVVVRMDTPHIFVPGQSLVMYQHDVCLGGGIISASVR